MLRFSFFRVDFRLYKIESVRWVDLAASEESLDNVNVVYFTKQEPGDGCVKSDNRAGGSLRICYFKWQNTTLQRDESTIRRMKTTLLKVNNFSNFI